MSLLPKPDMCLETVGYEQHPGICWETVWREYVERALIAQTRYLFGDSRVMSLLPKPDICWETVGREHDEKLLLLNPDICLETVG